MTIPFSVFDQVEMRVGEIVQVDPFPAARKPAYKVTIDFGEFGLKQSSAQITVHYSEQSLIGRRIIAVTNFNPKRIAGFLSEVLVLGVPDVNGDVVLLMPEQDVALGARVF
ncbi:MAG: tRNA-binding protein [bacterium]|nr:tRNA-binding protein [bacterium]